MREPDFFRVWAVKMHEEVRSVRGSKDRERVFTECAGGGVGGNCEGGERAKKVLPKLYGHVPGVIPSEKVIRGELTLKGKKSISPKITNLDILHSLF